MTVSLNLTGLPDEAIAAIERSFEEPPRYVSANLSSTAPITRQAQARQVIGELRLQAAIMAGRRRIRGG